MIAGACFLLDKTGWIEYIIAMRIIAGSKRGMKLLSPKTQVSRPVIDRVKESLFSVLDKYDLPESALVADLFCGVGSLGLEALSRGAAFVTFVERDQKIFTILKRNIEKAGFVKESKVVRADAFKVGADIDASGNKYSLVFVDPPYLATKNVEANSSLGDLLVLLGGQVADNGIVVVRTERKVSLLDRYGQFQVIERRRWGTMVVTLLRRISE
jgi:16S rRNA (guanine(966)-N(2))-methyltransferase RsmD